MERFKTAHIKDMLGTTNSIIPYLQDRADRAKARAKAEAKAKAEADKKQPTKNN